MGLFAINIKIIAVGNSFSGIWEVRYAKSGGIKPMHKRKEQKIHSCDEPLSSAPTASFQRAWWLRRSNHIPLPAKSNPWLFFPQKSVLLCWKCCTGLQGISLFHGQPCSLLSVPELVLLPPQPPPMLLLATAQIDEASGAKGGLLQSSLVPFTEIGLENSISHVLVSLGSCLGQPWLWECWGSWKKYWKGSGWTWIQDQGYSQRISTLCRLHISNWIWFPCWLAQLAYHHECVTVNKEINFSHALWINVRNSTFLCWRASPTDDYTARKLMPKRMFHSSSPHWINRWLKRLQSLFELLSCYQISKENFMTAKQQTSFATSLVNRMKELRRKRKYQGWLQQLWLSWIHHCQLWQASSSSFKWKLFCFRLT